MRAPSFRRNLIAALVAAFSATSSAGAFAADEDQLDKVRRFAIGTQAAQSVGLRSSPNLGSTDDTVGQEAAGVGAEARATQELEQAEAALRPFGASLFLGQSARNRPSGLNPEYRLAPGDRVSVNLFGAQTFSEVVPVDAQGNLFVPEVGPVQVAGVPNRLLQSTVESQVRQVFTENVQVYVNLQGAQTLGVFVTGGVLNPGRYPGLPNDSLLAFIDQAGGIDLARGSFRNVAILRDGRPIERADLYRFLREGVLPTPQFRDGDVILVGPIGGAVAVTGEARATAAFEFPSFPVTGREVARFARPKSDVSHVAVSGARGGQPFNVYLSLAQFQEAALQDGDLVEFQSDLRANDVFVEVAGEHLGASRFAVARGARLDSVLDMIAVDPNVAATDAIYLERESVARDQKRALDRSLDALERSALAALSQTQSQASIRQAEAQLVLEFVKRARDVQPDGRVVVSTDRGRADVRIEPGDRIVIPQQTDLVLVTGEVTLPQAVAHRPGATVSDYVEQAGGYSERADASKVIVIRASGETLRRTNVSVRPGDQIMILPIVDLKAFEVGKDLIEVLFRVAIIAATVIAL